MSYPKRIMIIRHAEEDGDKNDPHLSTQGWRRSYALADLFALGGWFAGARFLFATDRSKHSNRCVETLTRLAELLGLSINHDYEDDEYKDLAKRLKSGRKYAGSTILVCWHHGNIPNLAKALGVKTRDLPSKSWPDDVYDRVWILDFDAAGLTGIRSEPQGVEV